MKRQAGKVSYNQHRWDSSGFHYSQTVTITKELFNEIVKTFNSVNRDILRALQNGIEYAGEGAYTNISQAQFITLAMGVKLKDGYNTFFYFV